MKAQLTVGRKPLAVIVSVAIAAFSLALLAVSASFPAEAREKKAVTLAMSLTPLSAPVIIAENKGYFSKNGLDVTFKDVFGGFRAINAIFEGEADIATSSETVVMFNSFKRSDFAIVSTFATSDNDMKIITRKDTGIRKVEDLAGHRIGTVLGASAQFFLDEALMLAGVDSSQVDVVHVNPEDSPSTLARGDIDAVAVWEPQAYLSKKKLGKEAVVVPYDKVYTETFNVLVLKAYAKKNPAVLEGMVRALIEATVFIKAHPEESMGIVAMRIDNNIEFIRAVWKDFDFSISLHQWLLTTLETEARWAIERQLVAAGKIPNYLDFLYFKTLDQVRPDAITVFR